VITTTHVVVNLGLARWSRTELLLGDRVRRRLFVLGGLAPDVGLFVMTVLAAAYYPAVRGLSLEETFTLVFDELFYEAPAFVVAHHLLHAPLVLAALLALGGWLRRTTRARPGGRLQAFALGCAVHTVVDIGVHHDDGPLLLFPFEWSARFISPVSYYDPDHYGAVVAPIDLAITVVGLTLVAGASARRRLRNHRPAPPAEPAEPAAGPPRTPA
jgi:hypothetical protein